MLAYSYSYSQDSVSLGGKIINFPVAFFKKINKVNQSLDQQLEKQTEKYLRRLEKKEARLKKKLYKLDSNATKNLFLLNTDKQYAQYLQKIKSDSLTDPTRTAANYSPYADSLQGSLNFLSKNPALLSSSNALPADVQNSLTQLRQLQARMQDADQLKTFIAQRKQQIKQYLMQFAHLPPGITSIYNDYNKELYYYNAQLQSYKDILSDPDKMVKTALALVEKMPAFQNFMVASNSMLSGLFPRNLNPRNTSGYCWSPDKG